MFRFTIRDVLWLTVVVAMGITLAIEHQKASAARKRVSAALNVPVSVDFVETPIDEAMLFVSVKQGVPIFFEGNWEGRTVTARLTNLPLRDILEGILPPLNLEYQVEDGWILVKPRNP